MSLKVFKNSAYYMAAALLPAAVNLFMLPVYSRYLSPSDYGIVALVLSLQSFLPIFLSLKIESSLSRFYFEYKDEQLKVFVTTLFAVLTVVSLVTFAVILFSLNHIVKIVFPQTEHSYYVLFYLGALTAFFTVFKTAALYLIRVQQKARLAMSVSFAIFIIGLAVSIVEVIILKRGGQGVVEATLITAGAAFFIYLFFIKEFFIWKLDIKMLREPILFSLPIIPHALSGIIFMYSDRIILEKYVVLSAIGLYMFSDKIASVFKMIVNEFNNAFLPYYNQQAKKSVKIARSESDKMSHIFVYAIVLMVVILGLFSVEIMSLFFDDRYFPVWKMMPLLASAYVFRSLYCFSSSALFFEKKTGMVALITISSGIANIVFNIVMIPKLGAMAAVMSTILSFIMTYVLAELLTARMYKIKPNFGRNIIIILYMYTALGVAIYINGNFGSFNVLDYGYKFLILLLGLAIGYKMQLLDFKKLGLLMRLKK